MRSKRFSVHHRPILSIVIIVALLLLCGFNNIGSVRSQPRAGLGVAIGRGANDNNNNNNGGGGGGDVVRRVHYERNYNNNNNGPIRRVAGPFDGVVPGLILATASSALQWWNEGRAVRAARALDAARREVVEDGDATKIFDPGNDGKLVHVTGRVSTGGGLVDPVHGLRRPDALQLERTTEAYQWKEQRSESREVAVGDGETRVTVEYRYYKDWTKRPVESNMFESPGGHYNPHPKYSLGRSKMTVEDARLSNGLHLPPDLVNQIANRDWLTNFAPPSKVNSASPVMLGTGEDLEYNDDAVIASNALYFPSSKNYDGSLGYDALGSTAARLGGTQTAGNRIAVATPAPRPEVGDVRVSWLEVTAPEDGVSILAQQRDGALVPWTRGGGDGGNGGIYVLLPGILAAEAMIEELVGRNKIATRLLRLVGWAGNFVGLRAVLSCIPALLKFVPFGIGRYLLEPIARIASSTVAFGASLGLSAAVISVAWLRFRPLLAAGLAIVSGAGFLGPFFYARWKRTPEVWEIDSKLHATERNT